MYNINKTKIYWCLVSYETENKINPPLILAIFENYSIANDVLNEILKTEENSKYGVKYSVESAFFSKRE